MKRVSSNFYILQNFNNLYRFYQPFLAIIPIARRAGSRCRARILRKDTVPTLPEVSLFSDLHPRHPFDWVPPVLHIDDRPGASSFSLGSCASVRCLDFFSGRLPVCAGDNLFVLAPEKIRPGGRSRATACQTGASAVWRACLRCPARKKVGKKLRKDLEGKKKVVPLQSRSGRGGAREARRDTRMDMERSLTRLEQKYK